ncbi:MAG: DUF2073 domain-containing protein [Nanoarchaeota archaeon]|nr:DUF2073 domain-containing protein [Nanoarchaeota archaeon]MCG2717812.1 DUF2073 domain-containing protein [Nanoarchaeota archaeon]
MLKIQFIPYNEIETLSSDKRVKKLLEISKENKIIVMEGRLKPEEETLLIQKTMEAISKNFKGIELCTIYPNKKRNQAFKGAVRDVMAKVLLGDREGLTVVGPANIIKDIKRNPNNIELLTEDISKRRS